MVLHAIKDALTGLMIDNHTWDGSPDMADAHLVVLYYLSHFMSPLMESLFCC